MESYTLDQLRNPETYQADKELFGATRKVAEKLFAELKPAESFGDFRRRFVTGEYAEMIFEYIEQVEAERYEASRQRNAYIEQLFDINPPDGVTIAVEGSSLKIKAPFDNGDLNSRLNRKGGHWDDYSKCTIAPLSAVESLPKIFANWEKKFQATQQAKAAAKAEYQAQRERERQEQRAVWAAERQREYEHQKAAWAAEDARRAKARASRVQVTVGEYAIGDLLNGRQITGFGQSWSEATLRAGQLYQECDFGRCNGEPVCVACFKCVRHCGCDSITVCYAYFE